MPIVEGGLFPLFSNDFSTFVGILISLQLISVSIIVVCNNSPLFPEVLMRVSLLDRLLVFDRASLVMGLPPSNL
jgi:hypothetical protein